MAKRLEGKVAFVTGAASGIGAATARLFIDEGARVILADMNASAGGALASELGDNAAFEQLDVTDDLQWEHAVDRAVEHFGRLDILVNSAGISDAGGTIETIAVENWNQVLQVNLTGTMLGCHHAVRAMSRLGNGGAIVNVASIMGLRAATTRLAYGTSKAGVHHLTKSVALHCGLSGYNIRCNSIHPGPTDTPILNPTLAALGGDRAELHKQLGAAVALQRVAHPREIATAILFLASDDASYVTATQLVVDGGYIELGTRSRP